MCFLFKKVDEKQEVARIYSLNTFGLCDLTGRTESFYTWANPIAHGIRAQIKRFYFMSLGMAQFIKAFCAIVNFNLFT